MDKSSFTCKSATTAIILCLVFCDVMPIERHYFVGIVEISWDYQTSTASDLPFADKEKETISGMNMTHGHSMLDVNPEMHALNINSSDTSFVKAVFRPYSDETYKFRLAQSPGMGLLGPLVFANPGDRLFFHCKNFARFDFTVHPHLVRYGSGAEPVVTAFGGKQTFEWHVDETDGPTNDESCILGAYHSLLTSLTSEIEAGLFGPLLICKNQILNGSLDGYTLETGEKLVFAIAKIYDEKDSVYRSTNMADMRSKTNFATINGLTKQGAEINKISLTNSEDCNTTIYLQSFSLGGIPDFHLLTTSCGFMLTNGRSMSHTLPLYPASFRSVYIPKAEIARYAQLDDEQCFLRSADSEVAAAGMDVPLFLAGSQCNSNSSQPLKKNIAIGNKDSFNISIDAVLWEYGNNATEQVTKNVCSKFWKLKFAAENSSSDDMLGPLILASISQRFAISLTIPLEVLQQTENAMSANVSLSLKMPEVIKELSHEMTTSYGSQIHQYKYLVKPSRIGTVYDPSCRPFIYSAALTVNGSEVDAKLSSFDTGLLGPLVICQNENIVQWTKSVKNFVVAPLVIDETRSWLHKLNQNCSGGRSIDTMNGLIKGNKDFGLLEHGKQVVWHLLSLPGREPAFQHTITFSDRGLRNPLYVRSLDWQKNITTQKMIVGSSVALHGSGLSAIMRVGGGSLYGSPDSVEKWQIYCELTDSMVATFSTTTVKTSKNTEMPVDLETEQYVIIVEEVDWDYKGPANVSTTQGGHHSGHDDPELATRRHVFRKVLFRLEGSQRTYEDDYLGILGPIVVLTAQEPVRITLINLANQTVSIVPGAGVMSTFVNGSEITDGSVQPGENSTFLWRLPSHWPFHSHSTDDFPECTATLYKSEVNRLGDLYAGLLGPLLLCPSKESLKSTDRRFFSLYAKFDEGSSSLSWKNNNTKDEEDSAVEPLVFDTVNGRLNGMTDKPGLVMKANETVDWVMFSIGDYNDDTHMVHFHGSSFRYVDDDTQGTRRMADTVMIHPGQAINGLAVVGRMRAMAPGEWAIHCHVSDHAKRGMMTQYEVTKP